MSAGPLWKPIVSLLLKTWFPRFSVSKLASLDCASSLLSRCSPYTQARRRERGDTSNSPELGQQPLCRLTKPRAAHPCYSSSVQAEQARRQEQKPVS